VPDALMKSMRATVAATPRLGQRVYIAANAVVVGDVTLADDVSVWHGVVARGDIHWIRIGARTNLQDGVLIHVERSLFPTELGADVSVGHGAVLHGCSVGDGALIGMGARVLNNAQVGAGAIVAAGAVVLEGFTVPPGHLAAGVPAVIKRELLDHETARALQAARGYLMYKTRELAVSSNRLYHQRFEEGCSR